MSHEDGGVDYKKDRKVGGYKVGGYNGGQTIENDLRLAHEALKSDKHLAHLDRIKFIKGDVCQTIPSFAKEQGNGFRVALLNLDLDLYEATKVALEYFVPRMVRGGVIVCDEYVVDTFGGESKAVDEYFPNAFGWRPKVKKFTWHSNPSAYIEIDW